ncbi:MAG TPA: amidohydrolase family protein [Puia sp.]|nr:amidohydrolase family protein [Puia sp.]
MLRNYFTSFSRNQWYYEKNLLAKLANLAIGVLSSLGMISCRTSKTEITLMNGVVIENARIISPQNQILSDENYIVIDSDIIISIGPEKPTLKGNFQTVDAKGKYVIPGLIDCHVHITTTDALSDSEELENPEIVKSFRNQLPKSYLYFGYTTLVDLGTAKPKRLAEFNKSETRPDLYFVGGGAVIGKGYGLTNWDDEMPNFIYQEDKAYPIPEKYLKENHTPEAVVKRIAESGAIAVKTYYEPGFDPTQPRFPTPSTELINILKREAHKYKLVLVVHGNSLEAHRFLGDAKVDIIAHGLWNWANFRMDSTNKIPEEISKVLDNEIENKIYYTPTLQTINGLKSLADTGFLNNSELRNVLPKNLIEYYKTNSSRMYKNVFGDAPKDRISIGFNIVSKQGKTSLKYVSDKNGLILFGTDTPASPTYGNPPGYNGYLEMLEMEKAGVPLSKILAAATIKNAEAFNLEKLYGTVEIGKNANLLILNKNPLKDITAYNDISQIIIKGKIINRNTLSARECEK